MSAAAIRVLVVDDEPAARRRLTDLLRAAPGLAVVGESRNGREAVEHIRQLAPDLVFLDMEMPECSGLEVVAAVGAARMPPTVFVTAHERYALPAFEVDAVDYLLKPFDGERFARALAKARLWLAAARAGARPAVPPDVPPPPTDRLWVRSGDAQVPLRVADIVYIAAEGNYVRLHAAGGQYLLRERMSAMLQRLDPAQFRRIHRSFIVNIDHVGRLLPWFGGDRLVMMSNGTRLTLSRNYREALLPAGRRA